MATKHLQIMTVQEIFSSFLKQLKCKHRTFLRHNLAKGKWKQSIKYYGVLLGAYVAKQTLFSFPLLVDRVIDMYDVGVDQLVGLQCVLRDGDEV